jgi:hypothetical protein
MKIPKGQPEAVNGRKIDNSTVKRILSSIYGF